MQIKINRKQNENADNIATIIQYHVLYSFIQN